MKRQFLLMRMLLLFALIVGSGNLWGQATLPFSYTSNGKPSNVTGFSDSGCGSYSSKTGTKFDSSGDFATLYFKGNPGKLTFDIVLNGNTNDNNEFTVSVSSNGTSFTPIKTYKGKTEIPTTTKNCSIEENEFPTGTRYIRWTYVNKGTGNVGMGNIKLALGAPTFSLTAGEYVGEQTLTISTTSDYKLKYTTDGSDPKNAVIFDGYTKDLTIDADMTVRAVAVSGSNYSAEKSAVYTILDDSAPVATLSTDALAFGDVEVGKTKDLTFNITPANLTGDLTIASNNEKYTISPASITQATTTTQTITVTAAPTAANDNMDGTITISGGGITTQYVTLSAAPYIASTISLVADPVGKGTFTYNEATVTSINSKIGASVTVTAVPADGYLFNGWTAIGATPASSDDAETEFTLSAPAVTLTANFIADPYSYVVLDETEIPTPADAVSYANAVEETITQDSFDWIFKGCKTKDLQTLQIRAATSDGESYIKLPALPGAIKTIVFSVTNGSAISKTGAATSTVLSLRLGSGTTNGTLVASSGSTSSNTKTIDLSELPEKYSTGYITASGSIRIWDITVSYLPAEDINVSVSDAKYATFSDYVARNFSGKGITVYTAKSDGTKVNLTEVEDGIVPANKGVVLYSASVLNNVAIPVATTDPSDYDDANNELVGINVRTLVAKTASTKTNYILSNETSGVGFYLAADDGAYLPAHRAYLSTTSPAASRSFLGFDDETTGIETIKTNPETVSGVQEYYNLNGQRVANLSKGLYIVNGKKVIINK